ncbi:MAG: acyl-CoA dehydrogenase family protein, partial [Myxococcales bacterium]|nr:acyl-CoA dehydrogenase family protein [Myxococcales bacterium]
MTVDAVKTSPPSKLTQPTISGDQFISAAKALAPILQERGQAADELRRIPEQTIEDLHNAGLFKLFQPARWGGYEAHPNTLYDSQIELAKGCGSTGWVFGVLSVHTWQLALFPEEAQDEVWGDDPSTLISSSYAPVGKVTRVDGGYRLSGRWSWSSGCDHCQWVMLGSFVPPDEDHPKPDMRTFLVPRSDYTIV